MTRPFGFMPALIILSTHGQTQITAGVWKMLANSIRAAISGDDRIDLGANETPATERASSEHRPPPL